MASVAEVDKSAQGFNYSQTSKHKSWINITFPAITLTASAQNGQWLSFWTIFLQTSRTLPFTHYILCSGASRNFAWIQYHSVAHETFITCERSSPHSISGWQSSVWMHFHSPKYSTMHGDFPSSWSLPTTSWYLGCHDYKYIIQKSPGLKNCRFLPLPWYVYFVITLPPHLLNASQWMCAYADRSPWQIWLCHWFALWYHISTSIKTKINMESKVMEEYIDTAPSYSSHSTSPAWFPAGFCFEKEKGIRPQAVYWFL